MSDLSVPPSADSASAPPVSDDIGDACAPSKGTKKASKSTKTKAKAKTKAKPKATTKAPETPAALRKSASWCITRLDAAVRASVNTALTRTQIKAISIRGYWILEAIADGGEMAQTELSALLGMDRSDMVRLIDSLESANLVARTRDAKDRRRQLIALTDTGNAMRTSLRRALRRAERAAVADCPPEVRAMLASLADVSVNDLENATANPADDKPAKVNTPQASKSAAEDGTLQSSESDDGKKRKKSKKKKRQKNKKETAK